MNFYWVYRTKHKSYSSSVVVFLFISHPSLLIHFFTTSYLLNCKQVVPWALKLIKSTGSYRLVPQGCYLVLQKVHAVTETLQWGHLQTVALPPIPAFTCSPSCTCPPIFIKLVEKIILSPLPLCTAPYRWNWPMNYWIERTPKADM